MAATVAPSAMNMRIETQMARAHDLMPAGQQLIPAGLAHAFGIAAFDDAPAPRSVSRSSQRSHERRSSRSDVPQDPVASARVDPQQLLSQQLLLHHQLLQQMKHQTHPGSHLQPSGSSRSLSGSQAPPPQYSAPAAGLANIAKQLAVAPHLHAAAVHGAAALQQHQQKQLLPHQLLGLPAPHPYPPFAAAPYGHAYAPALPPALLQLYSAAPQLALSGITGSYGYPLASGLDGSAQQQPEQAPPEGSKRPAEDEDKDDDQQARALKRARLVWTPSLHKCFEDAVKQLGVDKAVPKSIMALMNVDGLTRENVASHLQKYRLSLKKSETASGAGASRAGGSSDEAVDGGDGKGNASDEGGRSAAGNSSSGRDDPSSNPSRAASGEGSLGGLPAAAAADEAPRAGSRAGEAAGSQDTETDPTSATAGASMGAAAAQGESAP